ncbi:protein-tyrosine phosphatase-like protein, partial [Coniella lustricola]
SSRDRLFFAVKDSRSQRIIQHFPEACEFIDKRLNQAHRILVHCHLGVSRSATIVAAYLMYRDREHCDRILPAIIRKRPKVNPNQGFRRQLDVWYKTDF